jgi:hypothetical protein
MGWCRCVNRGGGRERVGGEQLGRARQVRHCRVVHGACIAVAVLDGTSRFNRAQAVVFVHSKRRHLHNTATSVLL